MFVSDKNEIYIIYPNPLKDSDSKTLDKIEYGMENDSPNKNTSPYKIPIYVVETNKIFFNFFKQH